MSCVIKNCKSLLDHIKILISVIFKCRRVFHTLQLYFQSSRKMNYRSLNTHSPMKPLEAELKEAISTVLEIVEPIFDNIFL